MKHLLTKCPLYLAILFTASMLIISCEHKEHEHHEHHEHEDSNHHHDNADANIKLVNDYLAAALVADGDKLKSLVSDGYMAHGPSATDSSTIDQTIENWANVNTSRSNQDFGVFAFTSSTVKEGDFAGDWANFWGNYSATDNASNAKLNVPWHAVYKIEDGKIVFSAAFFDNLAPSLASGAVVATATE